MDSLRAKIGLAAASFLTACIIADLYLAFFYIQSDGIGITLSASRWWDRYWTPTTEEGYRDYPLTEEDWQTKKIGIVLGDSFAAGQGIEAISDRFAERTALALGNQTKTFALAKCGWNTFQEADALQRFLAQKTPAWIALSYYSNDIEHAASQHGLALTEQQKPPAGVAGFFINSFDLPNLIYWRIFRMTHDSSGDYWKNLTIAYDRKDIWESHTNDLERIIHLAAARDVPLYPIIFPTITAPDLDRRENLKIIEYFKSREISSLDLYDLVKSKDSHQLIVNNWDGHPNSYLHGLVAERLTTFILQSRSKASLSQGPAPSS